ncbi:MAG: putative high-affinity branched-chain amino acid transporter, amino acid-binding protein [Gemmatimonadetes bacterium]|nr:putative high-affinity branched-chain amino acid transporter, amino acid-binding protein [Gemmatimonadota bacterium]
MHPAAAARPRSPAVRRGFARIRLALPLALCLPAGSCRGLPGMAGDAAPVVFGLPVPLTATDGTPDPYGELSRNGAQLAAREINAAGGAGGHRVDLRVRDDRGDDSTAIGVARDLAGDPAVLAVIGHVYSGPTLKAAPIYEAGRVAAVATTATSPEITRLGPWIFRLASNDSVNAAELARVARGLGARAEVMYSNEDYGQGLSRSFVRSFTREGGAITGQEPYLDDTRDLTPYVERLRARRPDVVLLAGSTAEGASRIIAEAHRLGIAARFMGGDGIESMASKGPAYDGTLVGVLFHRDRSPRARAFYQAYRAAYGKDPDSSAALAYDAVYLLAAAVRAGHTDRAGVRDWLATVGQPGGAPALEGAGGRIAFDADGDPLGKACVVGILRNGTIQLSKDGR